MMRSNGSIWGYFMLSIEKSVFVKVPVDIAYATWANYRSFPAFTNHVKKVDRITRRRTRWVVEALGYQLEFEAEIDQLKPNKFISWHSVTNIKHFGSVYFEKNDSGTTLTLRLLFDTENLADDLVEDLDLAWGEFENVLDEIMGRYKTYCEQMWLELPAII